MLAPDYQRGHDGRTSEARPTGRASRNAWPTMQPAYPRPGLPRGCRQHNNAASGGLQVSPTLPWRITASYATVVVSCGTRDKP
jgi:hypothetical protein